MLTNKTGLSLPIMKYYSAPAVNIFVFIHEHAHLDQLIFDGFLTFSLGYTCLINEPESFLRDLRLEVTTS